MALTIVERPSPNHDARPDGAALDMLVLHYTGMKTGEEALARLCDPAAKVSAHYTIDLDGQSLLRRRNTAPEALCILGGRNPWNALDRHGDCEPRPCWISAVHERKLAPFFV